MHDRGLTTTIDWRNKDANGHSMSADKHGQLHRLRVWQERIRTKNAGERNLKYALSEIDRMVSALGVPKPVKETASVIYRQALEQDLIRGRSIGGVATSALYTACRKEDIPRSLEEVTSVSRVDQREIGRTYRYIADELDINLEPTNPRQFVPRFCSDLDVDKDVETKTVEIIDLTTEKGSTRASHRPGSPPRRSTPPDCSATKPSRSGRSPTPPRRPSSRFGTDIASNSRRSTSSRSHDRAVVLVFLVDLLVEQCVEVAVGNEREEPVVIVV